MTEGLELAQAIEKQISKKPKWVKNRWWPALEESDRASLPKGFAEKWEFRRELQAQFDKESVYESAIVLPQIWSHSNLDKIQALANLWMRELRE